MHFVYDGANWHEAPWKPGLFTFWLWSGHCIRLAFASKSMIQILIFWTILMAFKNKSYLNVIIWIILQLGLQKACWSHQVERENNVLPGLTSAERHNLIGFFFVKIDFIGRHWEYRVEKPGTLWEYRVTWQGTADNLYTCVIINIKVQFPTSLPIKPACPCVHRLITYWTHTTLELNLSPSRRWSSTSHYSSINGQSVGCMKPQLGNGCQVHWWEWNVICTRLLLCTYNTTIIYFTHHCD